MPHRRRAMAAAAAVALMLSLAACSSTGGKKAEDAATKGDAVNVANTKRLTIAMITHESPGDTFWDLVQKGAQAAAHKDNIDLKYSSDPDGSKQANLVQTAIDSKVDGIALTLAHPDNMAGAVKAAEAAHIPVVAFNSGLDNWKSMGIMEYFGQDENLAGLTAGQRLSQDGAKHALCVIQEQGQVALEARCAGIQKGFSGTTTDINVDGTDQSAVLSSLTSKLTQDRSIDAVVTLGAPIAEVAVKAIQQANSKAKLYTFDTNAALVPLLQSGQVQWAIDQQPYLQGYEAVDALWLYLTNGDLLGGGKPVLTGPSFIDKSNIATIATYAQNGTR